jgi:hypothetical protein
MRLFCYSKQMPRNKEEILIRDELGRKQCIRCLGWHTVTDFYPAANTVDHRRAFCKFCAAKEDSVKRHHLGLVAYEAMLKAQGECCAVCGIDNPAPDSMWTIDHDHNCCPGTYSCGKCIRGLICRRCNMAIGLFKDSPDALNNAANYLRSYYA